MVLNIFPRRERPAPEAPKEIEQQLPEPSPEALEETKKTTRRGTRGGRGRRKPTEGAVAIEEAPAPAETKPARPPRAPRSRTKPVVEATVEEATPEVAPAPVARRTTSRKPAAEAAPASPGDLAALIRVVEAQGRQLEALAKVQEQMLTRSGSATAAPPARVGVFVDAANVELAVDRLRTRIDWRKVLALLTENRSLVRAMAYSPVHDDPGVSIETQRFAEPFLGKGYKVVTKPLKRFADGTIKANVDIEMACDILEMIDRLDVVCLVSGDGDFQRLVEDVQAKGVRVEVIAVGSSTAASLRNAADHFIDLQTIVQKVKT